MAPAEGPDGDRGTVRSKGPASRRARGGGLVRDLSDPHGRGGRPNPVVPPVPRGAERGGRLLPATVELGAGVRHRGAPARLPLRLRTDGPASDPSEGDPGQRRVPEGPRERRVRAGRNETKVDPSLGPMAGCLGVRTSEGGTADPATRRPRESRDAPPAPGASARGAGQDPKVPVGPARAASAAARRPPSAPAALGPDPSSRRQPPAVPTNLSPRERGGPGAICQLSG
jgi:hypothetical protein